MIGYESKTILSLDKAVLERVIIEYLSSTSRGKVMNSLCKCDLDGSERVGERGHHASTLRQSPNVLGIKLGTLGIKLEKGSRGAKSIKRMAALQERYYHEAKVRPGLPLREGAPRIDLNAGQAIGFVEGTIKDDAFYAMDALAYMLQYGAEGVARNVVCAVRLYERVVNEGNDPIAMFNLGALLDHDADGVERDIRRAKRLFEREIEKR